MAFPYPASLDELERLASALLPADVRDFAAGGALSEHVLRRNRTALEAVTVTPRVLTGATSADARSRLLRTPAAMPVAIAPMAYQRLLHPDGEVAAAAAARDAGVPYVVSTMSSTPWEEIARTGADLWFQLYWTSDAQARHLVRQAERHDCQALVLTVDVPVMARRLRDVRNAFTLPAGVRAVLLDEGSEGELSEAHRRTRGSAPARHTAGTFHPGLTLDHVRMLREWSDLPLVVKGVLDPDDARTVVRSGADAVVVSNHGGRQFGAAPAACTRLAAVVEAVGDRCSVLFDSGVRGGIDVLRALALGADGVFVGRPVLWGLALGGKEGVTHVLSLLQEELTEMLLLSGCRICERARELTVEAPGP